MSPAHSVHNGAAEKISFLSGVKLTTAAFTLDVSASDIICIHFKITY